MHFILLDGYNFIHAIPRFRRLLDTSLRESRAELIRELGRFATAKKGNVAVHIFFDSKAHHDPFDSEPFQPGVEVHFSQGESADENILEFVRTFPHKPDLTVVTDDRNLARTAGDEGAITLSAAGFAHRLSKIQ